VKWLGDGVMVYFRDPGSGVVAALELVDDGRTVNLASQITEYARPGEVLVTQEVVGASAGVEVTFIKIGPVELKGISGVRLHAET
jgi:class 3 adenylate cyclase